MPWLLANGVLVIIAYFLGSIPSGYLAGRWLKGIDIRQEGSGSMGATNVLRTLGKVPAIAVLSTDILKGIAAIILVRWSFNQPQFLQLASEENPPLILPWMITLAGLAALIGHSKPVWLNFKGGKSVATSLGVLLALDWRVAIGAAAVFGLMIGITRIVSISSISAAIAVSVWMLIFHQPLAYLLFAILGGIYVIWLHRTNIQRLLAGVEPKLGQKLPDAATETSTSDSP